MVSGEGHTIINGVQAPLKAGETVSIPAGQRHTLFADTDLEVIEIQMGDEITGDDNHMDNLN